MTMSQSKEQSEATQHALLIALGECAKRSGFIDQVNRVEMHQKTVVHNPQEKVMEFFVAQLAGLPYLKDISRAAHPLDQDGAAAMAWGQRAWADYSGVARTLEQLRDGECEQILDVCREINQVWVNEEIDTILKAGDMLVWDGDLSGLPVCKSSKTYPNAAYGHMNDAVCLGYQAAVVSMVSPTYGRLWLSIEHHPGNVTSATQGENLVRAAEARSGVHPRRRVDLLEKRIEFEEKRQQTWQSKLQKQTAKWQSAQQIWQKTCHECEKCQTEWQYLEQCPSSGQAGGEKAKFQAKLELLRARIAHQELSCERSRKTMEKVQAHLDQQNQQVETLHMRLAQFEQENCRNDRLALICLRLDAGFSTYENLAWLIEMGYIVYTKVRSTQLIRKLLKLAPENAVWVPAGQDALLYSRKDFCLPDFHYPVQVALEQFTKNRCTKYGALLYFGPPSGAQDLQLWFSFYNHRETIEAGIKEIKHVFYLHHIKVRTEPAIRLQEGLVIFAANFIRWALRWLSQHATGLLGNPTSGTLMPIKDSIQVMAHTSAAVIRSASGCTLIFSGLSCFAGKTLSFPCLPSAEPVANAATFSLFLWFANWLHKT
jgi:hypothetical protein